MKIDVNLVYRRIRIASKLAQEGIKGRNRIGIQQRISQARLADLTQRQVLPLVASVAEAHLPVPRLEIIAKLAHFSLKSDIEEHIPVGKLLAPETTIVNTAEPDAGSHGCWDPVNSQPRISDGERITRVRDWHANSGRAKPYAGCVTLCVH